MVNRRQRLLDELLILRARDGSREAFVQLVARWQERLWRHAFRLVGREDAAWDVLQESWLAISRSLGQLDDPARFRTWAYTIVTRRAADWGRANGRAPVEVQAWPEEGLPVPEPESGGDLDVERLRRGLRRLDRERRALLALRYVDGFDTGEIARILDIPAGTVRSRLHRARSELREIIERMKP